jgi:enoyl-CoA hydratase/carnithine racemase
MPKEHFPMSKDFRSIIYAVQDGVAVITLNRPERYNSYDIVMRLELLQAIDMVDADDAVRAVIITGAGKAFCAGADVSGGSTTFDPEARGDREGDNVIVDGIVRDGAGQITLRLYNCLKPVIGAINGVAAGAGASISCAFDIRMAADTARFGFVFARRGVTPEAASSWFLPRAVGIQTALEWCYTGRMVSAVEALERGFVRSIHAADELLPAAQSLAREIASSAAPVSIALVRQLMWRMMGASHPMEAHRADTRAIRSRGKSADAREGVAAFLEKRQPDFPDRLSDGLPDIFPGWSEPEFR